MISPNDQQRGIVTYTIRKKIDWWTLKRAAGPEKPSTETVLNPEIIDSILDRMAQVSTTQDQLANTTWTSLEDLLRAAEDHMSATNYKKFYKEIKKKYDFDFFDDVVDHSYDEETDHRERLFKFAKEVKRISDNKQFFIDFYKNNKERFMENNRKVIELVSDKTDENFLKKLAGII